MNVTPNPPTHHTYLFTIWEERSNQPEAGTVWRYCLEDPHSGKKYFFVTLAAVMQFLEQMYRVSKA